MYEYNKMNLSGTDINVKDSTARESAGSAKTEAENASGIATEALTTVREHSVKFASLEATTDAQGVDITTLKSQVGTGTLNTAASSLIPAVNEVNNGLTNVNIESVTRITGSFTTDSTGNIALPYSNDGRHYVVAPITLNSAYLRAWVSQSNNNWFLTAVNPNTGATINNTQLSVRYLLVILKTA